jgi:hypothetical protein
LRNIWAELKFATDLVVETRQKVDTVNKKRTFFRASDLRGGISRMSSAPNPQSDADQLEAAVDQAIAACGGMLARRSRR